MFLGLIIPVFLQIDIGEIFVSVLIMRSIINEMSKKALDKITTNVNIEIIKYRTLRNQQKYVLCTTIFCLKNYKTFSKYLTSNEKYLQV